MHYIPTTKQEEKNLLKGAGVTDYEELINIIPSQLRVKDLNIGLPLSEMEIEKEISLLCKSNINNKINFLGNGIYDHFIPKAVDFISGRSEFYTSYTPYQAEVSQGTLQYLYEYQSMIAELSGMDIANASLYDGASALAEACILSLSVTKNSIILYSSTINDNYIEVMKSYLSGYNCTLIKIPELDGTTNINKLRKYENNIAAVLMQSPNKYGILEYWSKCKETIKNTNSLLIAISNPISLSIIKSPGESGADIFVGQGQSIGNYINYGGPLLGLIAVKEKYKRKMPGRIIGKTCDKNGKPGFVLTLQTREQHIRRDKATSNICTNQGLLALRATIYLSLLGKQGLPNIAKLCYQKSHYAAHKISNLDGYTLKFSNEFLIEFIVKTKFSAKDIVSYCNNKNILLMVNSNDRTDSSFRVSVTEKRTRNEIDYLINCLKEFK